MPTWLSQMFLWISIVVVFGYVFDEKIEACLDKIILKIKETKNNET